MNALLAALPFFSVKHKSQIRNSQTYKNSADLQVKLASRFSGVAKYIKNQDKSIASGVTKYIANHQLVIAKLTDKPSSVANYLQKQALCKKIPVVASSVDKYLFEHKSIPHVTGVKKYIAKKSFDARIRFDVTGVEKYHLEQQIADKKKAAAVIVENYLAKQDVYAKKLAFVEVKSIEINARKARIMKSLEKLATENDSKLSTVAIYVKKLTTLEKNKPVVSGVDKYLAYKIVETSKKEPVSGVAKYLLNKSIATRFALKKSSVEKYLQKLVLTEKTVPIVSSVAKYMLQKSESGKQKLLLSGVAKYLVNTKATASAVVKAIKPFLEGEFIPVGQQGRRNFREHLAQKVTANSNTGVGKYLENKADTVLANAVTTGVQKYLANKPIYGKS